MSREAMKQPEALRLADALDAEFVQGRISNSTVRESAVELRRLHEVNQDLLKALHAALETEQEPVLWLKTWPDGSVSVLKTKSHAFADHELEPLYTTSPKVATNAASPLRERLAQPEQEPVAFCNGMPAYEGSLSKAQRLTQDLKAPLTINGVPLYPKREWVGLTDEEIGEVISGQFAERNYWVKITKALESKLKEKNT